MKKLSLVSSLVAVLALGLGFSSPSQASTKVNGYTLNDCYTGIILEDLGWPDTRPGNYLNLCTKKATDTYTQAKRNAKKPNFAKDYVLVHFQYRREGETLHNYVAVTHKGKGGKAYVLPYEGLTADGRSQPKIKFNANSNAICFSDEDTFFQSIPSISYFNPSEGRTLCFTLRDDGEWEFDVLR